eukprot:504863-Pleurochrysis_carterae.AAC.2
MLSALMQFLDDSLLDSLVIAFRFDENKKLKEVWQTDAAPILSKLETIKSFKIIVNNDGCALAKQVDKWLAKYALRLKAINLTTFNKCRDWCNTGQFGKTLQ